MHVWAASRTLPKWRGGVFRKWLRQRERRKAKTGDRKA
jgi:hypothetical protein